MEKLIGNTGVIGRGNVHVRIDGNPQVSRYHVMLRCFNSCQYQIVDLGSRNGTFVGGNRVILPVKISDEADIRLGGQGGVDIFFQQIWDKESGGMTMDAGSLEVVTILVCDIHGFGKMMETVPASELAPAFGGWTRNVISLIQANGGVPDKFVRDAIVAYWTNPESGSATEDALQTAAQIVNFARQTRWPNGEQAKVTTVVHRGKAALGMGPIFEAESAATGPTVNAALNLEPYATKTNLPVIITDACFPDMTEAFRSCFHEVGAADVGGSAGSLMMYGADVQV